MKIQQAVYSSTPIVSATDTTGVVGVHISTSPTTISANFGGSNTQRLGTFITDGKNVTTITGNIFAQNIQIDQNPSGVPAGTTQLIWQTPIDTGAGGLVQFNSSSISEFQAAITSNMDFNGKGATAIIDPGVSITGNVINSVAGRSSELKFCWE